MNLLLYGDAPDRHSGLARIIRDMATISCSMPEFRIATFGRGAIGSSKLPWPQYSFDDTSDQWGERKIQKVWQDFAGSEGGAILTVWDASRLLWFTGAAPTGDQGLDTFLGANRTFQRWGYFMVDATGPDCQTLPYESRAVMQQYDRVLVASEWAAQVARRSGIDCEWMPHPINGKKFHFRDTRSEDREHWGVSDRIVVGMCATNQARKDWPTAFAVAGLLAHKYRGKFLFWVHTDSAAFSPGTYWNLHALARDYGIPEECLRITFTGSFTDSMMASYYSACDATMLCSGGEGFGYPIAESLACGCPCVTQDYAAGAELTHEDWRIAPAAFKLETSHNVLRAVHSPYPWAKKLAEIIETGLVEGDDWRRDIAEGMTHLYMDNLKGPWRRWLKEGVR